MKNGLICMAISACALLFGGCDINEMSSLQDISRPYAGEYKCTKLLLGGEEMLERFEYIKLKLDYYGDYSLTYCDSVGGEGGFDGKYRISEEEKKVTLTSTAGGKEQSFVFPYEKGKVIFDLQFNEKLLHAEFSAP